MRWVYYHFNTAHFEFGVWWRSEVMLWFGLSLQAGLGVN